MAIDNSILHYALSAAQRNRNDHRLSAIYERGRMHQDDEEDSWHMLWLTQLRPYRVRGEEAYVEVWGIDCDGVEATTLQSIPATYEAFKELRRGVYENAEGPCAVFILPISRVDSWQSYYRDRYAEQAGY